LFEAILAIWLLSRTQISSIAGRIGFVAVAGLLASLPTNISYWNWYGFPTAYTLGYMAIQIIGFAIAGTVAAFILPRKILATA
jgi:fatty acid desaturase